MKVARQELLEQEERGDRPVGYGMIGLPEWFDYAIFGIVRPDIAATNPHTAPYGPVRIPGGYPRQSLPGCLHSVSTGLPVVTQPTPST
jgi:hypothetical protein